jgi:magnesium transporter
MIVDSAIYVDGRRSASRSLEGTHDACHDRGGFAWIGLYKPTEEEFASVTGEFELHPLAVEDAVKAHQRPKVEHYGDAIFVVLKSARYLEDSRRVKFGEIHAFLGADFLVTVRYGEASALGDVRRSMENEPALLRLGPAAILYAIMDQVVDDYTPVAEGLENDIDEIETEVFGGNPRVSRRIYEVSREVLQFHRATQPLAEALEHLLRLEAYGLDGELRKYLRDVRDHTLRITEQVQSFRELLSSILSVNLTLVSVNQNDEVKKVSAWAAILVVPTIITGIYGMNFERMPELAWRSGYPFALTLMVVLSVLLYGGFKRSGWL